LKILDSKNWPLQPFSGGLVVLAEQNDIGLVVFSVKTVQLDNNRDGIYFWLICGRGAQGIAVLLSLLQGLQNFDSAFFSTLF